MPTAQALREAAARQARRRRRLQAYGQWQPFTDAAPVRRHVQAIRATGMSLAGIVRHTGVNIGTLDHLLYGKTPYPPAAKIRTENAEALLAYWPTLDDYDDGAVIDATGTRRRVQALAAAGWPSNALHQHVSHITHKAVERLRTSERVTARTARAVRAFYRQAAGQTPEAHGVTPWIAARTRTYAVKNGYADAMAWDDDTIDDPNAQPEYGRELSFLERAALRREEIIHLAWCGNTPEQIVTRLDGEVSISTVRQIVQDWRTGQKRQRKQVAA